MTPKGQRAEAGSVAVKRAILDAAVRQFAERGFTAIGIRDIAAEADVNPAIVIRHFGSKEGLFIKTVTVPDSWRQVMAGPIEHVAEQFVRFVVESRRTHSPHSAFAALTRASDRPEVQRTLQDSLESVFVAPLVARLPQDARLGRSAHRRRP